MCSLHGMYNEINWIDRIKLKTNNKKKISKHLETEWHTSK